VLLLKKVVDGLFDDANGVAGLVVQVDAHLAVDVLCNVICGV
jgi:hypothetical protein